MSKEYVEQFRNDHTDLNISKLYRTKLVLSWHDEVTAQIPMMEIMDGIEHIKIETGVAQFDMVFIDGSPFTGSAELERVYGANVIIMDDTMDIKCYDPMMRLIADPAYELLIRNDHYRNGFAIFKKIDYANS